MNCQEVPKDNFLPSLCSYVVYRIWYIVRKNLKIHKAMLLTEYDLRTSFSSPRKEGARATSDKQLATDFQECPSVDMS